MNVCMNTILVLSVYLFRIYEEYMNVCMNIISGFYEYFVRFYEKYKSILYECYSRIE